MSTVVQNGRGHLLPEYAMDNLGTSFKIILVNSAEVIQGELGEEIFIPDYQGLIKKVAIVRAAHPMKLKAGDIRFLRKTLGLRSKDLAEKLDISPEHLSRCESGEKVLSLNSEKVLRTLVILEGVYVLQKAIEDSDEKIPELSEKISKLLCSLKDIISGLKISSVHSADEEVVLHMRRGSFDESRRPANDEGRGAPEWAEEAA